MLKSSAKRLLANRPIGSRTMSYDRTQNPTTYAELSSGSLQMSTALREPWVALGCRGLRSKWLAELSPREQS